MSNLNNTTSHDFRAIVVKEGHEGAFQISTLDGSVIYDGPNDCLPDWAPEGLINADLHERRQWYIARLGKENLTLLGQGSVLDVSDLKWNAMDGSTMDVVEIGADVSWRAEKLAGLLGLTPEGQTLDENIALFDKGLGGEGSIEREVANSYEARPTDADLLEHDEKTFADGEGEKRTQNG